MVKPELVLSNTTSFFTGAISTVFRNAKKYGFKIYAVDGEWIRHNLGVRCKDKGFEHAGHGYVHEFIPLDEIWVSTHHYEGCPCKNIRPDRKTSKKYFESTIIHEIIEFKAMELGASYRAAHKVAQLGEDIFGILKDPYTEEYTEEDEE